MMQSESNQSRMHLLPAGFMESLSPVLAQEVEPRTDFDALIQQTIALHAPADYRPLHEQAAVPHDYHKGVRYDEYGRATFTGALTRSYHRPVPPQHEIAYAYDGQTGEGQLHFMRFEPEIGLAMRTILRRDQTGYLAVTVDAPPYDSKGQWFVTGNASEHGHGFTRPATSVEQASAFRLVAGFDAPDLIDIVSRFVTLSVKDQDALMQAFEDGAQIDRQRVEMQSGAASPAAHLPNTRSLRWLPKRSKHS